MYLVGSTGTIDTARATQILALSQSLCESIISPITVAALPVVLAVAARAFTNVTSAHQASIGTGSVSYGSQGSQMGIGGLYLSRSDKATLRRLNGRSGAFSIDLLPKGVSGVQFIYVVGGPTGGGLTLTFSGQTTVSIPFSATSTVVQDALTALSTIGFGNVSVVGGPGPSTPWVVTFTGALANSAVATLSATPSLTGGTNTGVKILVSVVGSPTTALANVPPWDMNGQTTEYWSNT
jgi:hypothetical protein